ncbi:MAG: BamA/OMP85 family outer membrane protein [Candidatus Hydrothermia bacterium]
MMGSWLLYLLVLSRTLVVREFRVEGTKNLNSREITSITKIKRGDKYYPPLLNVAAYNLIEALKDKGFFEASVTELKVKEEDSLVFIKMRIKEGPRYKIGSFQISWLSSDTLIKGRIFNALYMPPGSFYNSSDLVSKEEKALEIFRNYGYLKAKIDREVIPDSASKTCSVQYVINSGPRYKVNSISISGLRSVRRVIVEREIRIKPGDYVSASSIIESIRRIYATGLFTSVYHIYNFQGDSLVSVDFILTERKARYIKLQGGIVPLSALNLNLETGNKNAFGNNQQITAKIENSVYFPNKFEKFYGEVLYTEPYFLSSPLKFNLKGFGGYSRIDTTSFAGIETYLSYFWDERSRSLFGIQWRKFFGENHGYGVTNKALFTSIIDRRDDALFPTKGFWLQLDFQSAGGFLSGDYTFYKYLTGVAIYKRIWKPYGVLATKITVAQIIPVRGSEIPLFEKYKVGGDGTLRGFRQNAFSTQNLLLLNSEIRSKINHKYGLSLIFDLYPEYKGKVWFSSGIGFRYFLPVGNLRIDWVYNPTRFGQKGYFGNVYINLGEMF